MTEVRDRSNPCEHMGKENVKYRANHQRTQNTDRHIPLRVPGLLSSGAHCTKTNERKENDARGLQDSKKSTKRMSDALAVCVGRGGWNIDGMVGWVDERPAENNEQDDDGNLGNDDQTVQKRGL